MKPSYSGNTDLCNIKLFVICQQMTVINCDGFGSIFNISDIPCAMGTFSYQSRSHYTVLALIFIVFQ